MEKGVLFYHLLHNKIYIRGWFCEANQYQNLVKRKLFFLTVSLSVGLCTGIFLLYDNRSRATCRDR